MTFHRAPRSLPSLSALLDALPGKPEAWAAYLDVHPRTFARWRARDMAPRPYQLALYWESNYGVAHLHTDAHNAACQSAAEAAAWKRECERLAGVVARLETDHDWGSANAPIFNAV
jgi:hypothetical protein